MSVAEMKKDLIEKIEVLSDDKVTELHIFLEQLQTREVKEIVLWNI
jgi:hypothetical protein